MERWPKLKHVPAVQELRNEGPLSYHFKAGIHSVQNHELLFSERGLRPFCFKFAAFNFRNCLHDAQGIILRQKTLFDQVMNQALE